MAKKASRRRKKSTTRRAAAARPDLVDDLDSIEQVATTAKLRRAALAWCLANPWAGADVGRIERLEEEGWTGWGMWTRP